MGAEGAASELARTQTKGLTTTDEHNDASTIPVAPALLSELSAAQVPRFTQTLW